LCPVKVVGEGPPETGEKSPSGAVKIRKREPSFREKRPNEKKKRRHAVVGLELASEKKENTGDGESMRIANFHQNLYENLEGGRGLLRTIHAEGRIVLWENDL